MIKFCCESFESNINCQGQKGISIEKSNSINAPYKIVYHITDVKNEDEFKQEIIRKRFSVNHSINGERLIQYCPWCGTHLVSSSH